MAMMSSQACFPAHYSVVYASLGLGFKASCYSQVWLQIRSFIKGSIEAASGLSDLSESTYMDESVITKKRGCRLNAQERKVAYQAYKQYEDAKEKQQKWDDADRVLDLCARIQKSRLEGNSGWNDHESPYDFIFVDEVQGATSIVHCSQYSTVCVLDCTQCELALVHLAVGSDASRLFLAGDTAQAVTHGVSFSFSQALPPSTIDAAPPNVHLCTG